MGVSALTALLAMACGGTTAGGGDAGATGDGAAPADGGGGGGTCRATSECAGSEYCDLGGTCGRGGAVGTCKARPQNCPDLYSPTCACDGQIYGNECDAHGKGADLNAEGGCPAPAGWIGCGAKYCEIHVSYCQRTSNDVSGPGQPAEFDACQMLPAQCQGKSDCACFPATTPCISFSSSSCRTVATGGGVGFEVRCPGG